MPPHHPAPFGEVVDFPDRRKYHPTHRPIPIRDLDGPARHVTLPHKPTFGERLVDYFRWHGDLLTGIVIGVGLGCLLTAALALLIGGGR